jgi:uncharacterized protein (TIGR03067 family)
MSLRTPLTAAILTLAGLTLSARADDPPTSDELTAKQLVGLYAITNGEKYGTTVPEDEIRDSIVRFTEDRVVVVDRDKKEIYGATYKLHANHKPAKISLVSKLASQEDAKAEGLIELKGDMVKLIYALPGGEVPTDFKTKDKQLMFVLKKAKETVEPK